MRKFRALLLVFFLLHVGFVAHAQLLNEGSNEWEVPEYSFSGVPVGDPNGVYTKYCADVIKCHEWMQKTPIGVQAPKRQEAIRFLYLWVSGCKDVSVVIAPEFVYVDKLETEFLLSYFGGWSKFELENKSMEENERKVQSTIAGIEAQIELYNNNEKEFASNKELKKFIKEMTTLKKKSKLEGYVRDSYKKFEQKKLEAEKQKADA